MSQFNETPVVAISRAEIMELAGKANWLSYDQYPAPLKAIAEPTECGCLVGDSYGWIGRAELDECMGRYALKR